MECPTNVRTSKIGDSSNNFKQYFLWKNFRYGFVNKLLTKKYWSITERIA